jgi:hypothetical protein
VTLESEDPLVARVHTLVAGTLQGDQTFPVDNIAGETIHGRLDRIVLHAHGQSVNLGEVIGHVLTLVRAMEPQMQARFEGLSGSMGDVYMSLDIT